VIHCENRKLAGGRLQREWKDREVITVNGVIGPEEMGVTQTHEHLFLDAMDHYPGYGYQLVIDDE
jgi:predicted metal-dependent phosphotriesterase family hydrolase